MSEEKIDVLAVGAGPTGLACGIEAKRAGLNLLIVEKGCLVNSIFSYPPGMTFFTSRERLEIGDIPLPSLNVKPARAEALEYYRCVAEFYKLPIRTQQRVISVEKQGDDFAVKATDEWKREQTYHAKAVILATGYYDLPNYLGIPGEDLSHVSHYYGDAHAFYRRKVVVIGAANSAAVAALDLYRHGADVTLIHHGPELSRHIKYWIMPDLKNRIKEGSIRAYFDSRVKQITPDHLCVEKTSGETFHVNADFVFALTGYHPDFDLIRSAGVELDPATLRPKCNKETLETNVPGLYLAGVIIAGRNTNEIFIENGRFHGKQIVENIQRVLAGRPGGGKAE
ncbi:MAG TPA: YpdA family putative bacillithiol disulfide reductase [Terriglobia bacterium]|nr:YpdA family putative bacillithiol disulfide reductase [Terriglobia bacterium]